MECFLFQISFRVGLMKDECKGKVIKEFIGLRKMYSVLIQGKREPIKKAKGVQ